jgi:hypothetical protein
MATRAKYSQLLGGLRPSIILADGESQGANRLTTYVDSIAPLTSVFDGYLIHSRSFAAPLSQAPQRSVPAPLSTRIRPDLKVPVLTLESEFDVIVLGKAAQSDSEYFRLWEVAGTTHVDSYLTNLASQDDGTRSADRAYFEYLQSPPHGYGSVNCPTGANAGEQHYVMNTALHDLVAWVHGGVAPPSMGRLDPRKRDRDGIVLGGVRTPAVDAPLASLSGAPAPGGIACAFHGQTTPFTPSRVRELYPTHSDFVRSWRAATDSALHAGALLPDDAERLKSVVSDE